MRSDATSRALFVPVLPILVASVSVVLLSCASMAGSGSFAELAGVFVLEAEFAGVVSSGSGIGL